MITTTQAVEEVLNTASPLPADMPLELVNVSALARSIQPAVEAKVKRPVKIETIAICVKRLIAQNVLRQVTLPRLSVDTFNVQSGLVEVTYAKTPQITSFMKEIHQRQVDVRDFLTIIYGTTEISIIAKESFFTNVVNLIEQKPKATVRNLGCLSIQFDEKYLGVPNVIYVVLRALAGGNINVIEMVSTYTELAFIVAEDDLQEALGLLQQEFKS